jgi:glucosamine-6-phosphate deaminase
MVTWDVDGLCVRVYDRESEIALDLADRICRLAASRAAEGSSPVLGLAAGATPRGVYRALELRRRTGQLDLSRAAAFGLDEYYPVEPQAANSFTAQLTQVALDIGLPLGHLRVPQGDLRREQIPEHCAEFERAMRRAGGIDLQLLGIGRNGHLGFNEPGSAPDSRTRLVVLSEQTRQDAATRFGGLDRTPQRAITMGLGTILEAREIALLAVGAHKAAIVKLAVEGEVSPQVPASFLRQHPRVTLYLDRAAASLIKRRVVAPVVVSRPGPPWELL